MVALRRFFLADKGPSSISDGRESRAGSIRQGTASPYKSVSSQGSQCRGVEQHFHKIEKQFEVMHDHLQARPMSPRSQATPSRGSSRLTDRTPRHVDLLDALFSSHRYHMQSSTSLSPTSPYNEDIAERNMTQFLQNSSRPPPAKKNVYSRLISALYQEDVAERNMARAKSSHSLPRSKSTRTRSGTVRSLSPVSRDGPTSRPRSRSKVENGKGAMAPTIVKNSSFTNSSNEPVEPGRVPRQTTPNGTPLRQQRSAPTLLSDQTYDPQKARATSSTHLGLPPAHKQGDRWSNTPLPDSPTLPMTMRREGSVNENQPVQRVEQKPIPSRATSLTSLSQRPPMTPRSGSKKNVRDLSINTELASRGQSKKIAHRAIQPPTPNTFEMKQNPSIAEIMNSPVLASTPTSLSPLPHNTNQKVAEIMDMFRQAYSSTHAVTPHPTFETLQEAIIREINSHEAFQRVPIPNQGPPFTPSAAQPSFDRSVPSDAKSPASGSSRTLSLKDNQLSKLIRRGSSKKHRRGSEANRSISTSVPSKVFRRAAETTTRRRHTDAPPPSPGFFDSMAAAPQDEEQQVTYMDILLRSQKSAPTFPTRTTHERHHHSHTSKHLDHSQSLNTMSSHSHSRGGTSQSSTTPSVYYMRAQTSASSSDSHPSFSVDDSDEEVIQLPSVGIPQVQIQGVDENNVTYVAGNTSPQTAYRLMNWPRKTSSGRTASLRGHGYGHAQQPSVTSEPRQRYSPSRPASQSRQMVRAARSVESY